MFVFMRRRASFVARVVRVTCVVARVTRVVNVRASSSHVRCSRVNVARVVVVVRVRVARVVRFQRLT
jgi:hypothetical protein